MLKKKAQAIAERDSGLVFDAENLTVAEYLKRWISGLQRKTSVLRPTLGMSSSPESMSSQPSGT